MLYYILFYFRAAENWIKSLISDEDVIKNLQFDPKFYAKFINCIGISFQKLNLLDVMIYGHQKYTKSVVDIGVIRFPDLDHPYFNVYRLSLKAYRDCSQTIVVSWQNSGLIGEYNSRKFGLRSEIIKGLKPEIQKKAMNVVNDLFKDKPEDEPKPKLFLATIGKVKCQNEVEVAKRHEQGLQKIYALFEDPIYGDLKAIQENKAMQLIENLFKD